MRKYSVFIIVLCELTLFTLNAHAQKENEQQYVKMEVNSSDSICLPTLSLDFYNEVSFLEHSYDYERMVKISQLKSRKRDVWMIGYVTLLGIMGLNSYLAVEYDWKLWIDIPCATVVALASLSPFVEWQNRLQAKIDALEAQTVYLCPINDAVNLGLAHFSSNMSHNTFGIGLKFSF